MVSSVPGNEESFFISCFIRGGPHVTPCGRGRRGGEGEWLSWSPQRPHSGFLGEDGLCPCPLASPAWRWVPLGTAPPQGPLSLHTSLPPSLSSPLPPPPSSGSREALSSLLGTLGDGWGARACRAGARGRHPPPSSLTCSSPGAGKLRRGLHI